MRLVTSEVSNLQAPGPHVQSARAKAGQVFRWNILPGNWRISRFISRLSKATDVADGGMRALKRRNKEHVPASDTASTEMSLRREAGKRLNRRSKGTRADCASKSVLQ